MATLEEVRDAQRKTWNKFSGGWKKWDEFIMAWLGPAGEAMLELTAIRETDKVLDVATGTGEPGLSAARRAARGSVTAVDVAEDMVRIASEKARARGLKNFEAKPFDGLRLPFEDHSFDVVLSRHGIIFFPDVEAAVRELARVAKPGGRVAAAYWLAPERNPWSSVPGRVVLQTLGLPAPSPDAPGIFRCAKPGMARALFEKAGLKDVREKEVAGEVVYKGFGQFWEMLNEVAAPIVSALANADDATRLKVRETIERELARFAAGPDRFALPWAAQVTAGTR